jgi:hypothetical protein
LVHVKIAELIGERGEWTVSRRSDDDTDAIFHSILATSVSLSITSSLVDAQRRLEAGEVIETAEAVVRAEAQHVAADAAEPTAPAEAETAAESVTEPAAFGWEPAPITIWTDLRKPVTGEFPAIIERTAA